MREYGVATISRLLNIVGLFCKRALSKCPFSSKKTYNVKEPTNRSRPTTIAKGWKGAFGTVAGDSILMLNKWTGLC